MVAFLDDVWSEIEERDGNDGVTAIYVLGPRIECVVMERGGRMVRKLISGVFRVGLL